MTALDDKVVLITGAGRGIGRAAALACARAGARLCVNDLGCDLEGVGADPSVVAALAGELEALGAQVIADAGDATLAAAPDRLVAATLARFGRLDAVFASAGIAQERPMLHASDADWDRMLELQLRAPMRLTRAAASAMQTNAAGGSIVLCSAQAAFGGSRGQSAYAAATAGITGFVRAAAVEARKHRIRINALCPLARTRMTEALPMFRSIRGDSLTPDHVAQVVVYLCSDAASEVTSEVIGVAGGRIYTLRLHETNGAFSEGTQLTPSEIAKLWPDVTRG